VCEEFGLTVEGEIIFSEVFLESNEWIGEDGGMAWQVTQFVDNYCDHDKLLLEIG